MVERMNRFEEPQDLSLEQKKIEEAQNLAKTQEELSAIKTDVIEKYGEKASEALRRSDAFLDDVVNTLFKDSGLTKLSDILSSISANQKDIIAPSGKFKNYRGDNPTLKAFSTLDETNKNLLLAMGNFQSRLSDTLPLVENQRKIYQTWAKGLFPSEYSNQSLDAQGAILNLRYSMAQVLKYLPQEHKEEFFIQLAKRLNNSERRYALFGDLPEDSYDTNYLPIEFTVLGNDTVSTRGGQQTIEVLDTEKPDPYKQVSTSSKEK